MIFGNHIIADRVLGAGHSQVEDAKVGIEAWCLSATRTWRHISRDGYRRDVMCSMSSSLHNDPPFEKSYNKVITQFATIHHIPPTRSSDPSSYLNR